MGCSAGSLVGLNTPASWRPSCGRSQTGAPLPVGSSLHDDTPVEHACIGPLGTSPCLPPLKKDRKLQGDGLLLRRSRRSAANVDHLLTAVFSFTRRKMGFFRFTRRLFFYFTGRIFFRFTGDDLICHAINNLI